MKRELHNCAAQRRKAN